MSDHPAPDTVATRWPSLDRQAQPPEHASAGRPGPAPLAPSRTQATYIGRFAPSPSGPLHAGSIVAALASYLDARAHDGLWLLRIEDIDPPRVEPGSDIRIRHQLRFLGLHWDAPPWYQSARVDRYQAAFDRLKREGRLYGCACTRREIAEAWQQERQRRALRAETCSTGTPRTLETSPHHAARDKKRAQIILDSVCRMQKSHEGAPWTPGTAPGHHDALAASSLPGGPSTAASPPVHSDETPYLGTCRHGLAPGRQARAWRFRTLDGPIDFEDRWLGPQRQHPAQDCGDFVLRRADGVWAYQLAVVVDDAEAGVTDVVRGADLLSSTGRQMQLQQALGYPSPRYLHLPLLMGDNGQKLSKQNGAPAIDDSGQTDAAVILDAAARALALQPPASRDPARWLQEATQQWRERYVRR